MEYRQQQGFQKTSPHCFSPLVIQFEGSYLLISPFFSGSPAQSSPFLQVLPQSFKSCDRRLDLNGYSGIWLERPRRSSTTQHFKKAIKISMLPVTAFWELLPGNVVQVFIIWFIFGHNDNNITPFIMWREGQYKLNSAPFKIVSRRNHGPTMSSFRSSRINPYKSTF